jgi:hypothetical protein
LIVFIVIQQVVLTDCGCFEHEVASLIRAGIDERGDVLDVEARVALVRRFVTQRVAVVTVDHLQILNVVVKFFLDIIYSKAHSIFLVLVRLFFQNFALNNVVLIK